MRLFLEFEKIYLIINSENDCQGLIKQLRTADRKFSIFR